MKEIILKKVKLDEKSPKIEVPIQWVLNATSLNELQEQCRTISEQSENNHFNYSAQLSLQTKSREWQQAHPLATIEQIDLAMSVNEALNIQANQAFKVDKEVADYLCELAEGLAFVTGLSNKWLQAFRDFKEYFKSVRDMKDTPVEKSKKSKK